MERRTLDSTSNVTVSRQWQGLRQGFRVRREVSYRGQTTVEVVHGITSLSVVEADASRLLELVREHWRIENQVHYVRDVTLGEDACQVSSGSAPQVLAACRNTVISLLHQVDSDSHAAGLRRLAARPHEAINLLKARE